MNANSIINDEMTLEEKLSAIEEAVKNAQATMNEQSQLDGEDIVPIDPSSLTICDGCE